MGGGFEGGEPGGRWCGVGGESGDGRGVEDLPDRERVAQDAAGAGRQPGGEQRVAAEGEEVGVRTHVFEAEEIGEEGGEQFLALSGRGAA